MREQDWYYEYEDAIKERDAALARVERLEAALRMYADEKNWSDPMDDYGNPVGDVFFNPIGCGEPWEPARAALEPQP